MNILIVGPLDFNASRLTQGLQRIANENLQPLFFQAKELMQVQSLLAMHRHIDVILISPYFRQSVQMIRMLTSQMNDILIYVCNATYYIKMDLLKLMEQMNIMLECRRLIQSPSGIP